MFRPRSPHRQYPTHYRWSPDALPLRTVRAVSCARELSSVFQPAPDYYVSGAPGQPFDFCSAVINLMHDVAAKCPTLSYIRADKILVAGFQARAGGPHGLQARVTPLRFPGGKTSQVRRGTPYQVQRYFVGEHEYLYVMGFCLPRFLDQNFDSKFVTIFHEMYHISAAFDGDLRRHEGRYKLHTHSQRDYDRHMAALARDYMATRPDPRLHGFLRLNYRQLVHRHGEVRAIVVPRPRVVPVVGGMVDSFVTRQASESLE